MQQQELIEILPELKAKVENYQLYGVVSPTAKDIKIAECRAYNLKLLAQQKAKKEYWRKVMEARAYNLALKQKQKEAELKAKNPIRYRMMKEGREIVLLEMVRTNKDILSSVR